MTSSIRRRLLRAAALTLVTVAAVAVTLIATAGAAQKEPMQMRTSVMVVAANGRATVTATVRFILLAPNGGRVSFYDRTNHRNLGSAALKTKSGGPCKPPARVCVAKLSVSGSKLALGFNRITGSYTPANLYFIFEGRTFLYRGVRPNCHAVSASTLPVFTGGPIMFAARHTSLCRGRVRNPKGGSAVTATSFQRATVAHNTVIAFGAQTLPCSTRDTGDLFAYSITTRSPGDLALQVYGHHATVAHNAHPKGYLCYESTIPFRTASGARARHRDGFYVGTLPHCRDNDGDDIYPVKPNGDDPRLHAAPCIEWQRYSVKHGHATWTVWFEPTTGDPRAGF